MKHSDHPLDPVLRDLAERAGLHELLETSPELLEKAWRRAREHAEGLEGALAPYDEPAHIYVLPDGKASR